MARSQNSDPLLSHNFSLLDVPVPGALPLAFSIKAAESAVSGGNFIGAKSVTYPDVTLEMRTIKEGTSHEVHQTPTGYVTTGDVTIEWALFNTSLDMWAWMQQAIRGRIAPRRSLIVVHTRNDKIVPQRMALLHGCLPTMWKPSGDMDATASEVLLESLTLHVHKISPIALPIPLS